MRDALIIIAGFFLFCVAFSLTAAGGWLLSLFPWHLASWSPLLPVNHPISFPDYAFMGLPCALFALPFVIKFIDLVKGN